MNTRPKSQRPRGRDDVLSLDTAIGALDRAQKAVSIAPVKTAFGSASNLLTLVRVSFPQLQSTLVGCWLMHTGLGDQESGLCRTGADLF